MSREIKFKAKRKDNNEWVYGYYQAVCHFLKFGYIHYIIDDEQHTFEVIPETVGQYLDEIDSHGHKLYWNDVIVVPELNHRKVILNNKLCFSIIQNFIDNNYDFYYLGNIHDNPELLDSEEVK